MDMDMDLAALPDDSLSAFDWYNLFEMGPIPEAEIDFEAGSEKLVPDDSLVEPEEPKPLDIALAYVSVIGPRRETYFEERASVEEIEQEAPKMKDFSLEYGPVLEMIDLEEKAVVAGRSNRRKCSLSSRNVQEEQGSPDGAFQCQELLDFKQALDEPAEEKPKRQKQPTGPPKMHQMDPRMFPKAKGAVYSRMNREKKKNELQMAKMALAKAQREIQFLKGRIAGLLHPHIGEQAVGLLRSEDNQLQ